MPSSSSRSRPTLEHRAVDIGEDHLAGLADALGEGARQVAAAAGDVEHPAAFPDAALFDGEVLPQPVQPGRHQIVHQVVALRHGMKHFRDLFRFLRFLDGLETEMGGFFHAVQGERIN